MPVIKYRGISGKFRLEGSRRPQSFADRCTIPIAGVDTGENLEPIHYVAGENGTATAGIPGNIANLAHLDFFR